VRWRGPGRARSVAAAGRTWPHPVEEETPMGFLRKAVRGGIAMKVLQIARREAAKPQNQAKAKELLGRLTSRGGGAGRGAAAGARPRKPRR
jgi:hypothetical protein